MPKVRLGGNGNMFADRRIRDGVRCGLKQLVEVGEMPENTTGSCGRVAVVTGAGRGIGRAIATELARRGFAVLAAARTRSEIEDLCNTQTQSGSGEITALECDVRHRESVENMLAACHTRFGRLDVLVNNAGVGKFASLAETTDEIWDAAIDTNLRGAFLCSRAALPMLVESRGIIVNISSVAAVRGFSSFSAYSASKAGLLGFSRAIREDLRKSGVRVTVVLAGATATSIWEKIGGGREWDSSKMIQPAAIARAVGEVVCQPPGVTTEEITLMPAGGAL